MLEIISQRQSSSSSLQLTSISPNSPIFLLSCFSFLLNIVWTAQGLRQQSGAIRPHHQSQHRQQRMCFQCHMPMQCKSGYCFGDFCVKSLVADKYVSKGCENRSNIFGGDGGRKNSAAYSFTFHGSTQTRSADGQQQKDGELEENAVDGGIDDHSTKHSRLKVPIPSRAGIAPGCIKMNVFGQPNVICYCNDADYCNGSKRHKSIGFFHFVPFTISILLLIWWTWPL